MGDRKIDILISTKNRCSDLLLTLEKIRHLLNPNVNCTVFDDGSTDGTSEKVQATFPEVRLLRNEVSKGYIYCRNKMLNETAADFAVSLDDDAHFASENPIQIISQYFNDNPKCGVLAARIFWGKELPENTKCDDSIQSVKSFVGCGHVWRMKAWHDIPNYPEWFEFYGEENFASLQLFKRKWEIHYIPELLVQHRVDLKNRTHTNKDFAFRHRRSLRADWYNFLLFFPLGRIPRLLFYSIAMQWKGKILKGKFKVMRPMRLAIFDLITSMPKLISKRNSLTSKEYAEYLKLNEAKVYWKPKK